MTIYTVLYPKDANAFDSLAEAYMTEGYIGEVAHINDTSKRVAPKVLRYFIISNPLMAQRFTTH